MILAIPKTERAREMFQRLKEGLTDERMDAVVDRAALETHAELVKNTPKRWTGTVRRSWTIEKPAKMERRIVNPNKVMGFLERGTRAHGPVTKKALFIALKKSAAGGWYGGLKAGVDFILRRRVKGIKAMRIVEKERPIAAERLREGTRNLIRRLVHG